jgi:hypothetical protein
VANSTTSDGARPSAPAGEQDSGRWNLVRRGLRLQLWGASFLCAGGLVALLGLLGLALTWRRGPATAGETLLAWLAPLGGLVALAGALALLLGVLALAGIPRAARVQRGARWGLGALPAAVALLLVLALGCPDGERGAFAVGLLALGLLVQAACLVHILRAAAGFWGDEPLRRRFGTWFLAAAGFNACWLGLAVGYNYGPAAMRSALESFPGEEGLYPVPVVLLALTAWYLVLVRRLWHRVPPLQRLRSRG